MNLSFFLLFSYFSFPYSLLSIIIFILYKIILKWIILNESSSQAPIFIQNCSPKRKISKNILNIHFSSSLNHIRSTQNRSNLKCIMKRWFAPFILDIDLNIFKREHIAYNFYWISCQLALVGLFSKFNESIMKGYSSFLVHHVVIYTMVN